MAESHENSCTLYIGNLSFYTTEEQLYALFGRVGEVKKIIMGLDRHTKTPCGFCFVEYYRRADTEDAVRYLNGCKLDDRIVRVDWDGGFVEGRQYGRGRSGGQVREEYRTDYDAHRGGWGKAIDPVQVQAVASGTSSGPTGPDRSDRPDRSDSQPVERQRSLSGGADEPGSKRSKQETNPRFREGREEDDDED